MNPMDNVCLTLYSCALIAMTAIFRVLGVGSDGFDCFAAICLRSIYAWFPYFIFRSWGRDYEKAA